MAYIIIAILFEIAALVIFIRNRKSWGKLFKMRYKRRAERSSWTESLIAPLGLFNIECALYTVYLLIVETGSLPDVITNNREIPPQVLKVGVFFLLVGLLLYKVVTSFIHQEEELAEDHRL